METILYLAHTQDDESLPRVSKETLTTAIEITKAIPGASLTVGLLGKNPEKAASMISSCGAAKYIGVSGENFAQSRYSSDSLALEEIVKAAKPTIVVAPTTSRFSRVLPGVAYKTGGRIDTHVSSWGLTEEGLKIQRWFYRQRMVATLLRKERPWFLVFDSGVAQPFKESGGTVTVEKLEVFLPSDAKRTKVIGEEAASSAATTIRQDADILFVAGAGWSKKQSDGQIHVKEAEKLILDFLGLSKASLGSSKSLVDQSTEGEEVLTFLTHMNQVGQTGATPRHLKGLSTCCHGEEPHVIGWRFISDRRAVNLDPNCGWAQGKADVLYVADAFKVIAKVNELLSKQV